MLFLITVTTSIQTQFFNESILRYQACSFWGENHFLNITLLQGTNPDSQLIQFFLRNFYWKLANGCSLKEMHTFSLMIKIQLIYSPLVCLWPFLDYMLKMLILADCSPEIFSSEVKRNFYFKVLVNNDTPWMLRVTVPMIFFSLDASRKSARNKNPFPGEIRLVLNHL